MVVVSGDGDGGGGVVTHWAGFVVVGDGEG